MKPLFGFIQVTKGLKRKIIGQVIRSTAASSSCPASTTYKDLQVNCMEKLPPPESQISVSGHYETVNGITTFVREKVSKTIYQIRIRLKPLRVETHNETCPNMRGVNPFENQECLNKTGCTGICKNCCDFNNCLSCTPGNICCNNW